MSSTKLNINRPAAWIEVTGEDAFDFLQGQFTNDLRSPAPAPATYGLWLDRKGRVLADSFILQKDEETLYIYSASSPASTIIERLEPYIIADDVSLRDLTAESVGITLWGERVDDVLTACGFERPDRASFLQVDHRFFFPGNRSKQTNIECVIVGPDSEETVAALSAAVKDVDGDIVDESVLERERILSGIPSIPRDAGPRDLPQEAALDKTAISFTKGCYLGQEVMARIRSMGQVRRVFAKVELDSAPETLPAPLYDGEKEIGSLRSVSEPEPRIGLALIRREVCEPDAHFSLEPNLPTSVRVLEKYS
ncbi:MAG TPA: hypothetical protein VK041_10815 [Opitutales bacterium]|nr:hypothetical protein [Opitutales bacterium]